MIASPRMILIFGVGTLVGCSSSTPALDTRAPVDAGSDAHVVADSGPDTSPPPPIDAGQIDASTACNALHNSIQVVSEMAAPMVAPSAAGGTTADGVYHATSWTTYTGPSGSMGATGATKQSTLELA